MNLLLLWNYVHVYVYDLSQTIIFQDFVLASLLCAV